MLKICDLLAQAKQEKLDQISPGMHHTLPLDEEPDVMSESSLTNLSRTAMNTINGRPLSSPLDFTDSKLPPLGEYKYGFKIIYLGVMYEKDLSIL